MNSLDLDRSLLKASGEEPKRPPPFAAPVTAGVAPVTVVAAVRWDMVGCVSVGICWPLAAARYMASVTRACWVSGSRGWDPWRVATWCRAPAANSSYWEVVLDTGCDDAAD